MKNKSLIIIIIVGILHIKIELEKKFITKSTFCSKEGFMYFSYIMKKDLKPFTLFSI